MKTLRKRKICKALGFKYKYEGWYSNDKVWIIDTPNYDYIVNPQYTSFEKELLEAKLDNKA